jgi:hypothetical protein
MIPIRDTELIASVAECSRSVEEPNPGAVTYVSHVGDFDGRLIVWVGIPKGITMVLVG